MIEPNFGANMSVLIDPLNHNRRAAETEILFHKS